MFETIKIKTGACPVCGRPYGYEKEVKSGMLVNEYSECTCKNTTYEKDVYKMHQDSMKNFKKGKKGEVA
jgi:hypothetical protein